MPFIEALDMDRFAAKRVQHAPEAAVVANVAPCDCDGAESAQEAIAAFLWRDGKPTANYSRLVRQASRLARNADIALDAVHSAVLSAVEHWENIRNLQAYLWRAVHNNVVDAKTRRVAVQSDDITKLSDVQQTSNLNHGNHQRYDAARSTLCWLLNNIAQSVDERKVLQLAMSREDDVHVGYGLLAKFPDMAAIGRELNMSETSVRAICKQIGIRANLWENHNRMAKRTRQVGSRWSQRELAGVDRTVWPIAQLCDLWDVDLSRYARQYAIAVTCDLIVAASVMAAQKCLPAVDNYTLSGIAWRQLEEEHTGFGT